MNIVLRNNELVYQRPRRLSLIEKEQVNAHVNEWLAKGIKGKDTKFEFDVKEKEAFNRLKFILSIKSVLKLYKQK